MKNLFRARSVGLLTLLWAQFVRADATLINGAGATFPYPLYSKWFSEFYKVNKDVQINYQSVGSGGGIRLLLEKTVDFGASDSPMTPQQMEKVTQNIYHLPTVLGAVVLVYNLPGVGKGLKLSPEVIADIFLGNLTEWTDPKIASLNPGVTLPNESILVVRRSDGSGTTGILTDYLAKISPTWKQKVGQGNAVSWPVGLGGKGNEGVTGLVKQTPGSIGYTELVFAETNSLSYAAVKNKAGEFILPTPKSVTAAASNGVKKIPDDFRMSVTDAEGKESYPLGGFTYLLVYKSMPKVKGEKLVQFLRWSMKEGQKLAEPLYYAPLPKELASKVESKIGTIELK